MTTRSWQLIIIIIIIIINYMIIILAHFCIVVLHFHLNMQETREREKVKESVSYLLLYINNCA